MFNKDSHCGTKPTGTETDKLCPNLQGKKIKDARQKGIYKSFNKVLNKDLMKAALDNGPLVATMEVFSDIFFNP